MKQIQTLFFFILLSLVVFHAKAQKINGGITAGFTASQVDGDTYSGYDKTGITAGGFIFSEINRNMEWQLSLRYIQKGAKDDINSEINDLNYYKMHLQYFELPFVLRYYYSDKLSFEGGLGAGYAFSGKEEDQQGELPNQEDFKPLEISMIVGINYHFNKKLFANFQFNYSMFPVRGETGHGTLWRKSGQYNNLLNFTINYRIESFR